VGAREVLFAVDGSASAAVFAGVPAAAEGNIRGITGVRACEEGCCGEKVSWSCYSGMTRTRVVGRWCWEVAVLRLWEWLRR